MPPRHTSTSAVASSSKRPGTSLSSNPPPLKRSRLDNRGDCLEPEEVDDDDDDVIIISDSRDENKPGRGKMREKQKADDKKKSDEDKLSSRDIVQFFRLDPKKLE